MPATPPAMNLNQFPVRIPSIMYKPPKEGNGAVTFNVEWAIPLSKSLQAININLQNNATLEFSQICGLIVDNSDCGSDLDFIFPDTDVTVSIPAYAPYTVLQVNTQQTQFFVRGFDLIVGDVTRFSVLNYAPMPVAVPITIQQQTAAIGSIAITGAGSTLIIPPAINGSLRGINVNVAWRTAAAPFNNLLSLIDGSGKALWRGNIAGQGADETIVTSLADLSNINVRFTGGVTLVQTGGFVVGGTIDVNAYFRTP